MPYKELDKLVNEKLLNQYIESRCRFLAQPDYILMYHAATLI